MVKKMEYEKGERLIEMRIDESVKEELEEFRIRYCLPMVQGLELEGNKTVHSYLRPLFLDPM